VPGAAVELGVEVVDAEAFVEVDRGGAAAGVCERIDGDP
jgi:hypothetical protein